MKEAFMIFDKTYHGFEAIVDLDRDISEIFDYGPAKDIPAEFLGSIRVRAVYAPYTSPIEKLLDMVEFNALPDDKKELINFLKALKEE